jgi:hypothetical protein
MGYYIKKPVLVHAMKFVDGQFAVMEPWLQEKYEECAWRYRFNEYTGTRNGFVVDTLEGRMTGGEGDYIVMGVKEELYPCRGDIFEETYECLEDLEHEFFDYAIANVFPARNG